MYLPKSNFGKWLHQRLPIAALIHSKILNFPVPRNLNYFYCFGAILLFLLASQIFSGIIIAMHYVPHIKLAFASKEYMRRSVNYGWLFTNAHSVGASFFFIAAYIHIGRALYYGSYKAPRDLVWFLGLFIYFIMLAIAFSGEVLSWSTLSTGAIIVISNAIAHIPLIGDFLVQLLLGDVSIGQATLNRLFILHIILPFILCLFIAIHIWAVHIAGQTNPLGIKLPAEDFIEFKKNALLKDILAICFAAFILALFVFYMPDMLENTSNFQAGDPNIITQPIAPAWYFMPFYTMLKTIDFTIANLPSASLGVFTVLGAFIVLFFVPFLDKSPIQSARFRPIYRFFLWLFIANICLLGYLGYCPSTKLVSIFSKLATAYYFIFFLSIMPFIHYLEPRINVPKRIPEAKKRNLSLW